MEKLNTSSDRIISIIYCAIKSEPDAFEKWVKDRASKYVYDLKEEKTMSYEWHLSEDRKEASLIEIFEDSDGAVQRLKNHSESPIASEVLEHVNIKSVHCFGNAKKDLIEKTCELIADIRVSDQGQEGLSAFLEKRKPNWHKQ